MRLYPHQTECVEELDRLFKTNNRVCLAWYTGAGKTNIFIEWIKRKVEKNPNIKIGISSYLTTEIRDQIFTRLCEFGLKDYSQAIVTGLPKVVNKNIVVFNPQSVTRTILDVKYDILIIDESHVATNPACVMMPKIILNNCKPTTKYLIVSATPWDTLAQKQFEGIPVLKRPLDHGLEDGLITDFKFYAEQSDVELKEEDFNRDGDLKNSVTEKRMPVMKSACIGKMKNIISRYDKKLGKKVIVICPPGNFGEVARTLSKEIGGLPYLQQVFIRNHGTSTNAKEMAKINKTDASDYDTGKNLDRFRTEKDIRFLYVINKCGVGFDMQDLDAIIDLTMSRNVMTLAQRIGRVARKNGDQEKSYFYVYDKSIIKDRLEWLVSTMIDFSLGAYDGWTTRTAKYRAIEIRKTHGTMFPDSTTLKEVVSLIRSPEAIGNKKTLTYVSYSKPTMWTLELAKTKAREFSSRTEMWEKMPSLYKWFRLNAKDSMDAMFPIKLKRNYWNEKKVIEAMKQSKSRVEFKRKFGGADYWLDNYLDAKQRADLKDKYLPESKSSKRWSRATVIALLKKSRTWAHIRTRSGARRWMCVNGGERAWKKIWEEIHEREFKGRDLLPRYPSKKANPRKVKNVKKHRNRLRRKSQRAS